MNSRERMQAAIAGDFDFRGEVSQYDLLQDAPAEDWQLGLPIGNGLIGAMLWGGPGTFQVTLNRSDLWDLKWEDPWLPGYNLAHLRELWAAQRRDEIQKQHDHSYETYYKLQDSFQPAGRLTIELDGEDGEGALRQRLSLYDGRIETDSGTTRFEMTAPPELPVVLLRIDPGSGKTARLSLSRIAPREDRYPKPAHGASQDAIWLEQQLPEAPLYRLAVFPLAGAVRRDGEALIVEGGHTAELAIVVVMGETAAAFDDLRQEVAARGHADLARAAEQWWHEFWEKSFVRHPDPMVTGVWFISLYLLGSSSRKPGWPPNLQGIWSDLDVPPWHADYHHDLNTEMNYWGIDAANHSELGLVFYDFWKSLLPEIRAHTRKYYGLPGIRIPASSDPKARELGGHFPVAIWIGSSAWVMYHYWLCYEHTLDKDFLRETAYPMLREQARFCAAYLQRDASGEWEIFPSNSPEQGGNSLEAVGRSSTIDLMLFKHLFDKAARAAEILDADRQEREQWLALRDELPGYPTEDGVLIDFDGRRFRQAHRHLSVLSPIYPGETHHRHSDPATRQLAEDSYREFIGRANFGDLCGDYCAFTPLWLSLVASRLGLAEEAQEWCRRFVEVYILANGLSSCCPFRLSEPNPISQVGTNPVFQIDSNGGLIAAVNEALMQSHTGAIDLFPGIPAGKEAAFHQLRARGAFLVSARRDARGLCWVHIRSERGGGVRVYNPWSGRESTLNGRSIAPDEDGILAWDTVPGSDWLLAPAGAEFSPLSSNTVTRPGLLWREIPRT